jgi:hypothetical protein
VNTSTLRKLASAVLLGLPTALFAHVLVFGSEHSVGGAFHNGLLELAGSFAFVATLIAAIGALYRRRDLVPGFIATGSGAAAWFSAIELCEQGHGVPVLFAAVAIAFAAWIVRAVVLAFTQTLVAVVAILGATLAEARNRVILRRTYTVVFARSIAHRLRLFSRPPPVFA